MNNFKKFLFFCFFISFAAFSEDFSNFDPSRSIEWQKIQLRDKISKQIAEAIQVVAPETKPIININIELDEIPAFISPQAPNNDWAPNVKKKKVKLTDIKMEQNPPEDAVVFAKMGLAAPIFGDEDSQQPQAPMLPTSIDGATAYARLVEHFNFFKYLRAVNIDIYLEKSLSKEQSENISSLVKSLNFGIGKITPVINFKPIEIAKPKPESVKKDTVDTIAKFSNVIALVLAVLVAGALALFIFKRLSQLIREQIEALSSALGNRSQTVKEKSSQEDEKPRPLGELGTATSLAGTKDEQVNGLQKFELLIQTNTSNATLLLKRWISAKTPIAQKSKNQLSIS